MRYELLLCVCVLFFPVPLFIDRPISISESKFACVDFNGLARGSHIHFVANMLMFTSMICYGKKGREMVTVGETGAVLAVREIWGCYCMVTRGD